MCDEDIFVAGFGARHNCKKGYQSHHGFAQWRKWNKLQRICFVLSSPPCPRGTTQTYFTGHVASLHPVATYVGNSAVMRCDCATNVKKTVDHVVLRCSHTRASRALDPKQNSSFSEPSMDLPFGLSKVLFMCRANFLDTITVGGH